MDKNDIEHLIRNAKEKREMRKREKAKTIEMNDWFSNSGVIEQTKRIGPYSIRSEKKHGLFLNPTHVASEASKSDYEEYLKTLEVDLNKYINKDDKEYW